MVESLSNKSPGTYTVLNMNGDFKKLCELGIRIGSKITIISSNIDPMIIRVGNSKIAIGKEIANYILVE
ncbi:FeoA family protein [Methanococcus aeolicus]|uniref:FeoA family protein n=1 Tax=Methanococcus aeolicus TaxID=42879 RepID=UPI001E3AC288|nr:FeoA family protein [Methanococcus aeolicus]UXM84326.1 ferrous iron transport protein A [Methanococcus aeolicus]